MPRKTTPTFVHEMPLRIDRKQRHALVKRFEVMHFPYFDSETVFSISRTFGI